MKTGKVVDKKSRSEGAALIRLLEQGSEEYAVGQHISADELKARLQRKFAPADLENSLLKR